MSTEREKHPGYTLEDNFKKALTELLILSLLSEKERYIGELTDVISARSHGVLNIVFPYAAVYRLEEAGFIREIAKRNAPDGRRRQYLGITPEGQARCTDLKKIYAQLSLSIQDVLEEKTDEGNGQ